MSWENAAPNPVPKGAEGSRSLALDEDFFDELEQRIRYVVRAEQAEEPDQQLCESFGIHRTTGWRWRKRLQAVGQIEQLGEHSRRPHHSPRETSPAIQQRVLELREAHGWGALKLQVLLAREGCLVSVATLNRILKRSGAIERSAAQRPATRRFERSESNQLWQMDFKGIKDTLAARCGLAYPCRWWTITAASWWACFR